ncbi:MAG: OmpA family protein, partial [Betaproteobacteria bacterium]
MSSSDDDSQQRFALGFLFALIALVISVVVGTVVVKRVGTSGAAKP